MGKQSNVIVREVLILAMWFMEQKVILFWCETDIRDEPARPWRSLTAHLSVVLKDMNLTLLHNIVTDLIIGVSNFSKEFFY